MSLSPFHIRRARPEDAAALAAFAARTFHETFAAVNTPEDMAAYLDEAFTPALQAAEIAGDRSIVLLAFATPAAGPESERTPAASPASASPASTSAASASAAGAATREAMAGDVEAPIIGYAHVTAGSETPVEVQGDAPVELKRFYVASAWQGRGLAQRLMRDVVLAAHAQGARTMWLGVWEHNPRAIKFYAKCGFVPVGSHVFLLGRDAQTDVIMARAVGGSAAPFMA